MSRFYIFNHRMIYQICEYMKQGVFLNISFEPQLITKLGRLIDIDKGNNFQEGFDKILIF